MKVVENVKELERIIEENRKSSAWARVLGFYNRLKESEDVAEKVKNLYHFMKSLRKKGYVLSKDCVIQLLDGTNRVEKAVLIDVDSDTEITQIFEEEV